MRLIAHRGLFEGPDTSKENNPYQILLALQQGYDCEIDFWYVDNTLFLGHDAPEYEITEEFLKTPGLWIHAKNLEAFYWLTYTDYNYFWHQEDSFTLTSHRYIWAYPGEELTDRSIMLLPERSSTDFSNIKNQICFGVCSDYVKDIKSSIIN